MKKLLATIFMTCVFFSGTSFAQCVAHLSLKDEFSKADLKVIKKAVKNSGYKLTENSYVADRGIIVGYTSHKGEDQPITDVYGKGNSDGSYTIYAPTIYDSAGVSIYADKREVATTFRSIKKRSDVPVTKLAEEIEQLLGNECK